MPNTLDEEAVSLKFARALAVVSLMLFASTGFVAAAVPAIEIPGASVAVDPSGLATIADASTLPYRPADAFVYPGVASALHPLIVWVRFFPSARYPTFVSAAPSVGRGSLYYRSPGSTVYRERSFGMREPFRDRAISRVLPTVAIPQSAAGAPLYLRLALDAEAPQTPMVRVLDAAGLSREDAQLARLASAALVFVGIFGSLAAANLFVLFFVREPSYGIYSAMMIANGLFAAGYLHESAWAWFWPSLSIPYEVAMAWIIVFEAVCLLAFARTFMKTRHVIPRTDRAVTIACSVLIMTAIFMGYFAPSTAIGKVTGRDIFLIEIIAFTALVFFLGLVALRAKSEYARFFVLSNAVVSISAAVLAISNFTHHSPDRSADYLALMIGQAIEGWLLFGALAYRLRRVIGAHTEEQQKRIIAQAEALAQARALLESRREASTDALTGIANRRSFDEMLEREWDRCARRGSPLSLLIIDVDHFKKYNDALGHVAGDDCLRRVAQAIASCARRPTDCCARYGGEEFGVILGDTDEAGAVRIARDVVAAVRALRIPHPASETGIVTASVGSATALPAPGSDVEIIQCADRALYRAKASGRDRVESERLQLKGSVKS